jgi:hypothetical protein
MPYLAELYRSMAKSKKLRQTLSTKKLMTYVQEKNEILEEDRHQDCHEFYMWLVNELNDEMIKKLKAQHPNYKPKDFPTPLEKDMFGLRTTRTICSRCRTGTPYLN